MERNSEYPAERPAEFWNKVYAGVVVTTFIVVTALWVFSRYFA